MATSEPKRTIDLLLVCAMIEARSCERIGALLGVLDPKFKKLYEKLHEAEERHCEFYMGLVQSKNAEYGFTRLRELAELDAELVLSKDTEFRFHSGVPA